MMQPAQRRQVRNFRKNLAILCADHGAITLTAAAAGITRVYLSRIIHGHSVPTLGVAGDLADALAVPLGDLVGSTENFTKMPKPRLTTCNPSYTMPGN
jgi:transcriptional regulator with XRE-family HTH domain